LFTHMFLCRQAVQIGTGVSMVGARG